MKIVFLDQITLGTVEEISQLSSIGEFVSYETTAAHERIERIDDAEVVITNKVVIDREVIDNCPSLKLICLAATGMDNVDADYARNKGIAVKNVSGYAAESVAQHTFSMLFYLLNQTRYYDTYARDGSYARSGLFTHIGPEWWELKNKHFGIIGLGNIGRRVAELATCFGCQVAYHSTSGKNTEQAYPHSELEELLANSDVISIHAPLNDLTRNLIGEQQLASLKPNAILLNSGRGGIIDEAALARALDKNQLYGAGLDVLSSEPIHADNPLLKLNDPSRLLITPHIAWTSKEARNQLVEGIIKNITSHF